MKKVYTWRREWISEYESPWSVFEKFKCANEISSSDVIRQMGTEKLRQIRVIRPSSYGLYNLSAFDPELTREVIGVDLVEQNQKILNKLEGVLPHKHFVGVKGRLENVYFRTKLYFCLSCLNDGHHSIFHQFKLLHHCPIHNEILHNSCPNCGVQYHYSLLNKFMVTPFTCICGYQYCAIKPDERFYEPWKQYHDKNLISTELNEWLSLQDVHLSKLKKMYFIPEIDFENYPDAIRFFLQVLGIYVNTTQRHFSVSSGKHINQIRSFEEKKFARKFSKLGDFRALNDFHIKKIRFDKLQAEFYQNSKQIMAGLSKHIRKTVISNHQKCLTELKNYTGDRPICKFAYAYVAWRRSNQNFTIFNQVDHFGRPYRLNQNLFEFPPNTPYLYDFFSIWEEQNGDVTMSSRASTKWLFNHIITFILMDRFKKWLRESETYIAQNIIPSVPSFYSEHPFFIAIFSTTESEEMEFHWWN